MNLPQARSVAGSSEARRRAAIGGDCQCDHFDLGQWRRSADESDHPAVAGTGGSQHVKGPAAASTRRSRLDENEARPAENDTR